MAQHSDSNHEWNQDVDDDVIVLEDEDGKEHRFILGEVLTVDERDYAVLLPIDEDLEEGVIFRIDGEEGDQMLLSEIDSDEEWEKVVRVYNEMEDEFDEDSAED